MSNRNFDHRVIIQRLQNQVYARNLYINNTSGQALINNPQNSDGNATRFNTYIPGAQTDFFRGLVGAGGTTSIGCIVNILPFTVPSVPTSLLISAPSAPTFILDAPIITSITPRNQRLIVNFTPGSYGGSAITNYEYSIDNGSIWVSANTTVSPVNITGLTNNTTYSVIIRAVNSVGSGESSNIVTETPFLQYKWTKINSTNGYTSAVTSSNLDTIILSSDFNTNLLNTNNKGSNWTTVSTGINNYIYGFTGSADTTKLAIARGGGYIYTSNNSGLSWIERTNSGIRIWQDITSSANGNKLIAVGTNLRIYISNDSGSTWTEQSNSVQSDYSAVACSSDGNIIVACAGSKSQNASGSIYKSTNGGINWSELTTAGIRNWGSIDISDDGNVIIAGTNGGYVYVSLNGGNTWTAQTTIGLANWITVSVSIDGNKFGAGKFFSGETLFLSFNQGLSWTGQQDVPNTKITAINFSQDGLSGLVQSLTGGCWLYNIE